MRLQKNVFFGLLGFALSVFGFDGPLWACAVCTSDMPAELLSAYNWSTALLSLVPLMFMGGVALVIRHYHFKKVEPEDGSEDGLRASE